MAENKVILSAFEDWHVNAMKKEAGEVTLSLLS